jgi:hypothetical protein
MWKRTLYRKYKRCFTFSIIVEYSLEDYFLLSRELSKSQHISLTEFNDMPPWRLHVYLELINTELEEKKLQAMKQENQHSF